MRMIGSKLANNEQKWINVYRIDDGFSVNILFFLFSTETMSENCKRHADSILRWKDTMELRVCLYFGHNGERKIG